jgi:hypothetical protein
MRKTRSLLASMAALAAACSAQITGPTPSINQNGLDPALICDEQLTTEVQLAGAQLSPLAIDAATGQPELAIPAITLLRTADLTGTAVADATPVALPDDPADPAAARVTWTSATSMSFTIAPELGLVPGLYEITVTNRNGRSATLTAALTAVPRPTLTAVEPDLICVEQSGRPVTLKGTGFLKVGDTLPTVAVGDGLTLPVDSVEDCAVLPGPTTASTCQTAHVTVPEAALPAGAYDVVLTNPSPAGCHSTDAVTLAIFPRPHLATIVPDLTCLAQGARSFTLTGADLLVVGTDYPTVSFGSYQATAQDATGCTPVAGTTLTAQSCTSMTVTLPEAAVAPGAYPVVVENPPPTGCHSEEAVTIAVVPPPSVTDVVPDLMCLAEAARSFTVDGSGFIVLGGTTLPTITFGANTYTPSAADGCAAVAGTLLPAESCTTLHFTVPQNDLAPGVQDLVVTNPDPAGCHSTETVTAAIVPQPSLQGVTPGLFCTDKGASFTLAGTGFVEVGGTLPAVTVGATTATVSAPTGCTAVAGTLPAENAESCTGLTAAIGPGAASAGALTVTVANPDPPGCSSPTPVSIIGVGAPVITGVAPAAVCQVNQPASMTIQGSGFVVLTGPPAVPPAVTVDGSPVTITGFTGCTDLGATPAAQSCTGLTFPVPNGGFSAGQHQVALVNPAPADCAAATAGSFTVTTTPTVTGVTPQKVCANGGSFDVTGSGYVDGSAILLSQAGGARTAVPTQFQSATDVRGTLASGAFAAGSYDVTVQNGAGCEATLPAALRVVNAPFVFFADPPMVYNAISLRVTIYASGINGSVASVAIRRTGTSDTPIALTDVAYDPARANRVLATLPANVPAGDYDILVTDELCGAVLTNGLHVTDTLAVCLAAAATDPPGPIALPFGSSTAPTPVKLRACQTPPAGFEQFVATPRAYLSPSSGGGLATPLAAVSFTSATALTGTVIAGLTPGSYDLVVVNPDGKVGFAAGAFTVVDEALPQITALTPGSVPAGAATITITGSGFLSGATAALDCHQGGATYPVTASSVTGSGTQLTATFDLGAVPPVAVCVMTVTNADGPYAQYSALIVTNPSGNPNSFALGGAMTTRRRAAAAAAVRMNSLERYLFAIGGDSGAGTPGLTSVEAAKIDALGEVQPFTPQRNRLPAGTSFTAAAVVGRFVYLPGGTVAGAPTTTVLRAYLLDPFEAPVIDDLDLTLGSGSGLDGGIWYYRVAAVLDDTDPNNPGGEALASEPLVVQLPSLPQKVALTLHWTAVPHAATYRIYRTPTPNLQEGDEVLVVEVPAAGTGPQSWLDDGSHSPGSATPMPLGSLGTWTQVGTLGTAREGAGVVAVPDPAGSGTTWLYVIAGRHTSTSVLSSYDYAAITQTAANAQSIGAFATQTTSLTGRWQIGAVYADSTRAATIPAGEAFVYVLPGQNATGAAVSNVDSMQVNPSDGHLSSPVAQQQNSAMAGGGNGYLCADGDVWMFGGAGGMPSTLSKKDSIIGAPTLGSTWAAGFTVQVARYLHATAAESGFVFVLGGQTLTEAATASTESTNF